MNREIKELNIIIKPTLRCNARCLYCHSLKQNPDMSLDLVQEIFRKLRLFQQDYPDAKISITWHGGEPMIMGPDFYKAVMSFQQSILQDTAVIHIMQSNATLYEGETRSVLRELLTSGEIGTCLDPFHPTRLIGDKDTYYTRSLRGFANLVQDGFAVGMIYVTHKQSLKVVDELYYFYRNLAPHSLLLHPLEAFDHPEYHLTSEDWSTFLKEFWRVWIQDDYRLNVFPLVEWHAFLEYGKPLSSCEYGPADCEENIHLVISPEGEVYPCHRFQDQDLYRIGNIRDMNFQELADHEWTHLLLTRKTNPPDQCMECDFYVLCNSGCVATHDESGKTVLCEGIRNFFEQVTK